MTTSLSNGPDPARKGNLDDRYRAFLETVSHLRPRLHRYCAKMTGSVLDGEDVMQEALFEAYRKLDTLNDPGALASWLFSIANRRSIDFIRRRNSRSAIEAASMVDEIIEQKFTDAAGTERALERIVLLLPPKERACVLLREVFDYSHAEIADIIGATEGAVKIALHRTRKKLVEIPPDAKLSPAHARDPERRRLLHLYVERFNRRDWDAVRALTSADARLAVADKFDGYLVDSPYFSNYERSYPWCAAVREVDGEDVVVITRMAGGVVTSEGIVRIETDGASITAIRDYYSCPWVSNAALSHAGG